MKILCICAQGQNRSKYLAQYLRRKGYSTKFGGIEANAINPITQNKIKWADILIIVRKRLIKILKKKFPEVKKKKMIVLDVTDSKRLIPKEFAHLKELNHFEFQKKWTRPQLRKAIKPHLKKISK